MMTEATFQRQVILWLKGKGCVAMKMPAGYASIPTGFPDVLALLPDGHFLALECKANAKAAVRPLQKEWVERLDFMFFARFTSPENWSDIKKEIEKII